IGAIAGIEQHTGDRVVLQALTDAGQIGDDVNSVLTQMTSRADSREHQELWTVNGPAGHDDLGGRVHNKFFAAVPIRHTGGTPGIHLDRSDDGGSTHREVPALHGRAHIGVGHRPASTLFAGDLVEPRAVLVGSVEIAIAFHAGRYSGVHEGMRRPMGVAAVFDVHGSVSAVVFVSQSLIAFSADEVRQDVLVAPAGCAIAVVTFVVVRAVP